MKKNRNNILYNESSELNIKVFTHYVNMLKRLALSIFEWVNLPQSMNSQFLEETLYFYGIASLLKDKSFGFINTKATLNGKLNIYELPTSLHCYSYEYSTNRNVYTGNTGKNEYEECILVQNNLDRLPTSGSIEFFALQLYECTRTCDVNIKAQKTPLAIIVDEKQRLMMENLYKQYDGNTPYIFGDKYQMATNSIQSINTNAPFVADKVNDYKKEILNEVLTFLGINNILLEKKERLVTDEANSNNELINLNLQSYFTPRKLACKQFNEKYHLTGTDKEISVKLRSDLKNIIKQTENIITDNQNKVEGEKQ